MVSAGGSGSVFSTYGAPGGDTHGYIINEYNSHNFIESDTNQTHGYMFGCGQNGIDKNITNSVSYSGGGGTYYGGSVRDHLIQIGQVYYGVSSSGSSYVSGHPQCNSISDSDLSHTGSSIHYSGIYFGKPVIMNGLSSFPNINDTGFIQGKEGNGAVKITVINTFFIL